VKKAYETLSDDDAREAYDDNRRRSLLESPIETATSLWSNYLENVLK
jgi:DnaJ-class molecular chaperone